MKRVKFGMFYEVYGTVTVDVPDEIKKLYEEQKLVWTLSYFFEKINLS